jgi:hypothetical protein
VRCTVSIDTQQGREGTLYGTMKAPRHKTPSAAKRARAASEAAARPKFSLASSAARRVTRSAVRSASIDGAEAGSESRVVRDRRQRACKTYPTRS